MDTKDEATVYRPSLQNYYPKREVPGVNRLEVSAEKQRASLTDDLQTDEVSTSINGNTDSDMTVQQAGVSYLFFYTKM